MAPARSQFSISFLGACFAALTLMGGQSSSAAATPAVPAVTPAAGAFVSAVDPITPIPLKADLSGVLVDAELVNGVIFGHACMGDAVPLNLSLVVQGRVQASSRTDLQADLQHACRPESEFSAFYLIVPPEQLNVLAEKGGSLAVFPDSKALTISVPIAPFEPLAARIAMSSTGL